MKVNTLYSFSYI